nr:hypothetical protein [uncultured Shinella sp.]
MTVTPVKFTVKKSVLVEGHEIGNGIYVGQKLSDTEIERSNGRNASYFLHFAPTSEEDEQPIAKRFDLDVTALVKSGKIAVS